MMSAWNKQMDLGNFGLIHIDDHKKRYGLWKEARETIEYVRKRWELGHCKEGASCSKGLVETEQVL